MTDRSTVNDLPNNDAPQNASRIFISYAHEDATIANTLAHLLTAHGLSVWIDSHEIALGDSILGKIDDGLRNSDVIVIIVTPASQRSRWSSAEVAAAVASRVTAPETLIIPVVVGSKTKLPPLLQDTQGIFVERVSDLGVAAKKIADQVKTRTPTTRDLSEAIEAASLHAASLQLQREAYLEEFALQRTKQLVYLTVGSVMVSAFVLVATTVVLLSTAVGAHVKTFHINTTGIAVVLTVANVVILSLTASINIIRRRKKDHA